MPAPDDEEEPTVTPCAVEGKVNYDRLLDQFGADRLTDEQIADFPDQFTRSCGAGLLRRT